MSIIPPWPDDTTYRSPQPYDQRGCCWPWGPDGPREKLPMRFGCVANRTDGGMMDPAWNEFENPGWLFVTELESAVLLNEANWYNHITADTLTNIFISVLPDGHWEMTVVMGGSSLPLCILLATAIMQPGWCGPADFDLPITTIQGPAPRPDRVQVTTFAWYEEVVGYLFE